MNFRTGTLTLAGLGLALMTGFAAPKAPAYHVLRKIQIGGDGGWDYLMADGASHRLYISRGTHVTVVDTATGKVVGDIPNTQGVHGIALAPKLNRGFTSNGRDNSVTVFDLKTLKQIQRVSVGKGPDCIIFDGASNRVFTFNGESGDATAVDAATGKVAGTIALSGRPEYAASDDRGAVFVNIEDKSEIDTIDSKALKVTRHWSLSPGDGPSGLAIDRKHHRLFSVCGNEKMVVSDADYGKVVATPPIGKGPDAAAFDPDSGIAFSSNGEDGTLTLVHESSPNRYEIVGNVRTEPSARTMALDPQSHLIYLATAKFKPAAPGAPRWRRQTEPGSFAILVVGP
jgi:YVTN family beta-propeller protein